MKKLNMLLIIFAILLCVISFVVNALDDTIITPPHHEEGKKFATAEIPIEKFEEFYYHVETGSPNIYDIANLCNMYELTYTERGQEAIREIGYETVNGKRSPRRILTITKEDQSGTWSFGHHLVAGAGSYEVFDYFMHTSNIQNWLAKNGIECIVNDYMILSLSGYFPPFIWVDTNQGDYYIILKMAEEGEAYNELTGENRFTCEIYDAKRMLETKAEIQAIEQNPPIEITLKFSSIKFDTPPIIKNERILVPIRALCEKIGATVEWEESTQTVIVTQEEKSVAFKVGDTIAEANGEKYQLDVAPEIINDRTLVPLRFVAESLGYYVDWVNNTLVNILDMPKNLS